MVSFLMNRMHSELDSQTPGMAFLSGRKSRSSTNAIPSARQRTKQPE